MNEKIGISVYCGGKCEEKRLVFVYGSEGVLSLELDGKEICRNNWEDYFEVAFKRMLELWGTDDVEEDE